MALNLRYQVTYAHKPVVPVRLTTLDGQFSMQTEALIDTGADVSLFDADLVPALNLHVFGGSAGAYNVMGIGGGSRRILCWPVYVSVIGAQDLLDPRELKVGFVPGLAMTVGNLLGRDFFSYFDLGLSHAVRTIYLGLARP